MWQRVAPPLLRGDGMIRQREDDLQKDCVRLLRSTGFIVSHTPNQLLHWLPVGARQKYLNLGVTAGFPDLTIIGHNVILFAELKSKTGRQSQIQSKMEYEITRRGHEYVIWKTIDDCAAWVSEVRR